MQSWIWRQGVTCRVCRRVRVPCWRCWIGAHVRAADRVAIGCFGVRWSAGGLCGRGSCAGLACSPPVAPLPSCTPLLPSLTPLPYSLTAVLLPLPLRAANAVQSVVRHRLRVCAGKASAVGALWGVLPLWARGSWSRGARVGHVCFRGVLGVREVVVILSFLLVVLVVVLYTALRDMPLARASTSAHARTDCQTDGRGGRRRTTSWSYGQPFVMCFSGRTYSAPFVRARALSLTSMCVSMCVSLCVSPSVSVCACGLRQQVIQTKKSNLPKPPRPVLN